MALAEYADLPSDGEKNLIGKNGAIGSVIVYNPETIRLDKAAVNGNFCPALRISRHNGFRRIMTSIKHVTMGKEKRVL
jgi:hypothetical protein